MNTGSYARVLTSSSTCVAYGLLSQSSRADEVVRGEPQWCRRNRSRLSRREACIRIGASV